MPRDRWAPGLLAPGLLAGAGALQMWAVLVAAPGIADSLGAGPVAMTALVVLTPLVVAGAALLVAARVRPEHRATVCVLAGLGSAGALVLAGTAPRLIALAVVLVAGAAASAVAAVVLVSLAFETSPPADRGRALVGHRIGELTGMALASAVAGGLTTALDLTWRAAFIVLSGAGLVAALVSFRLPGAGGPEVRDAGNDLGAPEIVRRALLVPTVRPLLAAYAVLGLCWLPLMTYVLFFLDERWKIGPGGRAVVVAGIAVVAVAALLWSRGSSDRLFSASPSRLVRAAMVELAVGLVALVLGANSPVLLGTVALFAVAITSLALVKPSMDLALLSLVPAQMRAHAAGLAGASLAATSALGGVFLLAGMDRRFGPGGALVVVALLGAQGLAALRLAAGTIDGDLDRLAADIAEAAELERIIAKGEHVPLLACRNLDFSYGPLQVLFGVDFTVDDGEMVALLGTNGAGKSTLLKVISGLCLPSRGSVRLTGIDITYVDAERRTRSGISQVPGGRGVYGPLSVLENLRVLGYSRGRDRASVEAGIAEAFDAFPRLAERKSQLASTLSGGEQQMLSLSRAYLVKPRLLLIDELSLGLAPKVVAELLEMVRRINADGTAVVIVEQSVNIALSLVDHAYFMEKGEIRFDGVAADLLARPDLLRSVFLEGARR